MSSPIPRAELADEEIPKMSVENEITSMQEMINKNSTVKDTVLIAIVRQGTDQSLHRKVSRQHKHAERSQRKPKVKIPLFVTTAEDLQATINALPEALRRDLAIVAASTVDTITLHVPSSFKSLKVFRCCCCSFSHKHEQGDKLLVSGDSTFHDHRLDQWQGRNHKHKLFLGDGVFIGVQLSDAASWASSPLGEPSPLPDACTAVIRENIALMLKDLKSGGPWWQLWRAPVTAMMKHLLCGADIEAAAAIRVTELGFFVAYRFAAVAENLSKTVTVSKRVLGFRPAALRIPKLHSALYFIPWEGVFKFLKVMVLRLCGQLWGPLKSALVWLASWFGHGPMAEVILSLVG